MSKVPTKNFAFGRSCSCLEHEGRALEDRIGAEFSREADDPSTQVRIEEALAKHAERTELDSRQ